jgi:hypothetical protein
MPCSRVNPKSVLWNVVLKLVAVESPIAEPKWEDHCQQQTYSENGSVPLKTTQEDDNM